MISCFIWISKSVRLSILRVVINIVVCLRMRLSVVFGLLLIRRWVVVRSWVLVVVSLRIMSFCVRVVVWVVRLWLVVWWWSVWCWLRRWWLCVSVMLLFIVIIE